MYGSYGTAVEKIRMCVNEWSDSRHTWVRYCGTCCSYRERSELREPSRMRRRFVLRRRSTPVNTHTHTRLTALFPGLPGWVGTRKVKPIWILLEQETVTGSGISWAICKSAPRFTQITTPAHHHSVFYSPDALPAAQPTASKHWRQQQTHIIKILKTAFIHNVNDDGSKTEKIVKKVIPPTITSPECQRDAE